MHLTCSHALTETFLSNLPSSPPPSLCLPPSSETFLCLSFTALRHFIRSQRALQIPPHPFYNIQLFSQQKHERIKQNMKPFLSYSKKRFFHQPARLSHPQGCVRCEQQELISEVGPVLKFSWRRAGRPREAAAPSIRFSQTLETSSGSIKTVFDVLRFHSSAQERSSLGVRFLERLEGV